MNKTFLNTFTCNSLLVIFGLFLFSALPVYGITSGQIDDFEDGTTMGWDGGSTAGGTLSNEPNGGPLGAGDNYLQFSRTTSAFHIGVKNEVQWTGDYTAAGVTAIGMDLNHIAGTTPMGIRLVVFGPGGAFTSINATPITQGWYNYTFSLDPADMMFLTGSSGSWPGGGTEILSDTLANVSNLLIRNDPAEAPTPIGAHPPHILATLGLDNIVPATCGDPHHPYPVGDVNEDCDVNFLDFALMALHWLECTHPNGCP